MKHIRRTTYYDILNLGGSPTDEQVRQAWKKLALKWHPDRNPKNRRQAEKMLVQINRAYAALKTKPQREAYNRQIIRRKAGSVPDHSKKKSHPLFSALREILWPFALKETMRHG